MKQRFFTIISLVTLVALTLSCKKERKTNAPLPDTTPADFIVSGFDGNHAMQQTGTISIPVSITYVSGGPEAVALSIAGLPLNTLVSLLPQIDTPTYASTISFIAQGAPVGQYTVTLSATTAATTKTYSLTLNVDTILPNPALVLAGNFQETGVCVPSGNKVNNVQISVVPGGLYNKVKIRGLWTAAGNFEVEANTNPIDGTLIIAPQTMNSMTFSGTGTFNRDTFNLSYQVTNGGFVNDNCTTVLTRLP